MFAVTTERKNNIIADADSRRKFCFLKSHGFNFLNICGSEHTPEEKPAWAPGVLQPSSILLESGDVCGENGILMFPSFVDISFCSFGGFTFIFY